MIIGVVGDMHLKENLGYADYITDRRIPERKKILEFIHDNFEDCDAIVLMGDNFNGKNNPSSIIREFVAFVKGFGKKDIYILAGNHEKFGDGRSAVDFMREMKMPHWHVITDGIKTFSDETTEMTFCPYMSKAELNIASNSEASESVLNALRSGEGVSRGGLLEWIGQNVAAEATGDHPNLTEEDLSRLLVGMRRDGETPPNEYVAVTDTVQGGATTARTATILARAPQQLNKKKVLFAHHAISGTVVRDASTTDLFNEPVLDKSKLLNKFDLIVGGHIHLPSSDSKVIITGSVFNNEVGEKGKKIWKIDTETMAFEHIDLPGRKIFKLENPTNEDILNIPEKSIVKVILTKKIEGGNDALKGILKNRFDAYLLLEQYPSERKKIHFDEGMVAFTPESLLESYAKERKIDINKLKAAYDLIKEE